MKLKYTGPSNEEIGTSAIPLPERWPAADAEVSEELAKEMLASGLYERSAAPVATAPEAKENT